MIKSAFIVQFDNTHGFMAHKKYPMSLSLTEKLINEIYVLHESGDSNVPLKLLEIDSRRIVSYRNNEYQEWMICYEIDANHDLNTLGPIILGMSSLILELLKSNPDAIDLGYIIEKECVLPKRTDEQKIAEVFLTPSTSLILERMQKHGVDTAARLSIWLKNEIQSDTVDIREAVSPLMQTNIVKVEMIDKTKETIFLIKDIFCYRAPPTDSLTKIIENNPPLAQKYMISVKSFFSPPPPEKGYNPTISVDDPNSPLVVDRENIARILANRLHYAVLSALREEPLSVEQIEEKTSLPKIVVQNSLWALESERIATFFEDENLWALITNPSIEIFMPEYGISLVSRKLVDKDINRETAIRYYQLLIDTWSENQ